MIPTTPLTPKARAKTLKLTAMIKEQQMTVNAARQRQLANMTVTAHSRLMDSTQTQPTIERPSIEELIEDLRLE